MKFLKLPLFAMALFAMSCQQAGLTVNIDISNLETLTTDTTSDPSPQAMLLMRDSAQWDTVAITTLIGGQGVLHVEMDQPRGFYLFIEDLGNPFAGFGQAGNLTLTGDAALAKFEGKLTGTPELTAMAAMDSAEGSYREISQAISPLYRAAQAAQDQATMDSVLGIYNDAYAVWMDYVKDFAMNQGALGAYVANRHLYMEDYTTLDSILSQVPEANLEAKAVVALAERIATLKRIAVGQPLVDLNQKDTSGIDYALSDVAINQYLLVDFWASWCAPCRAQNPALVAVYNDYHEKGFDILGVSFDQSAPNWIKAIREDQLNWFHMSDLKGWGNSASELYAVRSIPQNLMIGNDGNIAAKNLDPEALRAWLAERL
ncbi:MAG: TlpA disulfide reductase family protein [Schleiferiaceae bacterium]|nr:TlpA disulfide reductase family protein [Schleiferiaceae bacterium]